MKKSIICLLLTVMILGMMPTFANNVLGYATYTDVVTYINHYPIPSYSFNGLTLIIAEDLVNYGFDVVWNEYKQSLTISRDLTDNDVVPQITFKPPLKNLGKRELTITTTPVKVFSGDCQYSSYGGVPGQTLINVEDMRCLNNVSVVWVPEINAVKVWVEDGLEMRDEPFNVRRFDKENFKYYKTCEGLSSASRVECIYYPFGFILSLAETENKNSSVCTDCYGTLTIVDIIDADGRSRMKWGSKLYDSSKASLLPYFYGNSDYALAHSIYVYNDDLVPHTASEHGGIIKYKFECAHSIYEGSIRVDCLPYI